MKLPLQPGFPSTVSNQASHVASVEAAVNIHHSYI
jgi:hypothetical protein